MTFMYTALLTAVVSGECSRCTPAVLEVYDGDSIIRKLLAMVRLDKCFMDAPGNTLAILWQL